MDGRLHLASCYNRISDVVELCGRWLEHALPGNTFYQRQAVIGRTKQRLADILHYPVLAGQAQLIEADADSPSSPAATMECAGLSLCLTSGQARPRWGLLWRSLREFALHWFYLFGAATAALWRSAAARQGPATLVSGVGAADLCPGGDDTQFIDYCRSGTISVLRSASSIIVQAARNTRSSQPGWASYARHPLSRLLRESGLSPVDYLRFCGLHLTCAWLYLSDTARFPLLCMLARDYAYFAAASMLNRGGLIENIVITNSQYSQQPLWMTDLPGRRYHVHMVFYSMMGSAFVYKEAPVNAVFPAFRYLRADDYWVWTEGQAQFLRSLGVPGDFHVKGPLVWRRPAARRPDCRSLSIAVFDVTPISPQTEKLLGLPYNYYRTSNAIAFLSGILAAREQLNKQLDGQLRIILKHKRAYHAIHDVRYREQIDAWCNVDRHMDLAPPDCNILSLIEDAKVVIVAPFSSPAYIAAHLGVPAIYYDPGSELLPTFEPHPLIHIAAGPEELQDLLIKLIADGRQPGGHSADRAAT